MYKLYVLMYTHTKLRTKLLISQASGCHILTDLYIYIVVSSQRLSAGKDAQCECFDMFRLKKDMFPKAKLNKNCFALFVQANQISSIRSRIIGQYDPICILYKCSNDFNGFAMMAS